MAIAMKKLFLTFVTLGCLGTFANAQVYINEMMANAPGADGTKEYFELRGTPNLSLSGYYLISLEGQGPTGNRGDINQFFNLGSTSIGANGYLIGLQAGSPYLPTVAGSTVFQNTVGIEWGLTGSSTVGFNSDTPGSTVALENSATSMLLVNIGAGAAPLATDDFDMDNDGILDALPAGWTLLDSVGLLDGVTGLATDVSYGAITFRVGAVGTNVNGNVIQVSGAGTSLYVGRKGESTGSTDDDWVGTVLSDAGAASLFLIPTDSAFAGQPLSIMQFGGVNAVPEPSTWAFLGLSVVGFGLSRFRRSKAAK